MKATIYRPSKSATQSGKARTKEWLVNFEHDGSRYIDNLMGWTGSSDMSQEVNLRFSSLESAINFVKKNYPEYEIILPHKPAYNIRSYADNFTD